MAKKDVIMRNNSKLHIRVTMRRRQSGLYNFAKAHHKEVGKLYNNYKTPKYKMHANFHPVM
jgi:hypothetical protein